MRRRRRPTRLPAIALALLAIAPRAEAAALASNGDASISHETNGTWTLAAGGATLTLAADASRDFSVLELTSASGKGVSETAGSDLVILGRGAAGVPIGSRASGFTFDS